MVSTSQSVPARSAAAGAAAGERAIARLNARVSAYAIDSALLVGFMLVFLIIGGAALLFTSDLGESDPPDSAYYAFTAVLIGGTVLAWSAWNIALVAWRAQTAGMYLVGVVIRTGDPSMSLGRSALRWIGFHPLLFHPLLLPLWGLFAYLTASLTLNQIAFGASLVLVFLCIAVPVAGLLAVLIDPERRALHDRIAGTVVVYLE
jgi:uncharacterized RDD family membrane protein YckC